MGAWDLERILLVVLAVLVLAGLGFIAWENSRAEELAERLPAAERQLAELGRLTSEIADLKKEIREDSVASGRTGPHEYIEQQAVESRIGKTRFNIAKPSTDEQKSAGYIDSRYVLTPAATSAAQGGRADFTRQEIATFLLYIEGNTTRMKVTNIRLDLSKDSAGAKLGEETWRPTVTITDRLPIAQR